MAMMSILMMYAVFWVLIVAVGGGLLLVLVRGILWLTLARSLKAAGEDLPLQKARKAFLVLGWVDVAALLVLVLAFLLPLLLFSDTNSYSLAMISIVDVIVLCPLYGLASGIAAVVVSARTRRALAALPKTRGRRIACLVLAILSIVLGGALLATVAGLYIFSLLGDLLNYVL